MVAAVVAGAGALVALKPEAPRPQPTVVPVLMAPEVIYDEDLKGFTGKPRGPFWASSQHAMISQGWGLDLTSDPGGSAKAEVVSREFELGGRPVEITIRWSGTVVFPAWGWPANARYKIHEAV